MSSRSTVGSAATTLEKDLVHERRLASMWLQKHLLADAELQDLELEIAEYALDRNRSDFDCMVYLVIEVADGTLDRLREGRRVPIEFDDQILCCWTTSEAAAEAAINECVDLNLTALLVGMRAGDLPILLDVSQFADSPEDQCLLVLAEPLVLSPSLIVDFWKRTEFPVLQLDEDLLSAEQSAGLS